MAPCRRTRARDEGAALLHDLELARAVGVESGEVAREFGGGIRKQEAGALQHLGDGREGRIVLDHAVEVTTCAVDQCDRVGCVVDQILGRHERPRLCCGEPELLEIREPVGALGELGILAGLGVGSLDLVERLAQFAGLAGAGVVGLAQIAGVRRHPRAMR